MSNNAGLKTILQHFLQFKKRQTNKQKPVILKEYSNRKQPSKISKKATVIKTV